MATKTEQRTKQQIIREFLALPHEALPGAIWYDEDNSAWGAFTAVQDLALPYDEQQHMHLGDRILLKADRPEWRDGVIITDE